MNAVRGAATGALLTGMLCACQSPAAETEPVAPCPYDSVKAAEGMFAAKLGFDTRTFAAGTGTELRVCVYGLTPDTLTIEAPQGVSVTPLSQLVPTSGVAVRFTITADRGAAGALHWHLGERARGSYASGPGPSVVTTADGWHLEPPEN